MDIRRNVMFEFASSQALGSGFLTERELDIQMVERLNSDPSVAQRNQMLHRHLTSFVPFIDGVDPKVLLKLRRNEEDAFVQFRAALRRAVDEVRSRKGRFTDAEAKELYADIIQPKLARIDSKVKAAQRTLLKGTMGEVLAWGGAITVGTLTGLLPSDLAALASTLGLVKIAADITNRTYERSDTEKEARRDEMYFLWKVKQAASK
jgi:hypothetical protein